jgi:hypothetical protein
MGNRITVQRGYALPYDGLDGPPKRRRKASGRGRTQSPAVKRQQAKMKGCAKKWRSTGKSGSYRAFMGKCLRG